MALAIIGGMPERFAPFATLYRRSADEAGHGRPPFAIASHGYVADTSQQAADEAYPPLAVLMNRIAASVRDWTAPVRGCAPSGRQLSAARRDRG
jgi:alkanesulfonate monooxygenase SsuD/methylene tetrahydromethanopterin reductase-like flavin-dependent oxidoreductase (luciferase family)